VPGMHIMAWFQATKTGEFELAAVLSCVGWGTTRCGGRGVFVHTPDEFKAWVAQTNRRRNRNDERLRTPKPARRGSRCTPTHR